MTPFNAAKVWCSGKSKVWTKTVHCIWEEILESLHGRLCIWSSTNIPGEARDGQGSFTLKTLLWGQCEDLDNAVSVNKEILISRILIMWSFEANEFSLWLPERTAAVNCHLLVTRRYMQISHFSLPGAATCWLDQETPHPPFMFTST